MSTTAGDLTDYEKRLEDLMRERDILTPLSADMTVEEVVERKARLAAVESHIPVVEVEISRLRSQASRPDDRHISPAQLEREFLHRACPPLRRVVESSVQGYVG